MRGIVDHALKHHPALGNHSVRGHLAMQLLLVVAAVHCDHTANKLGLFNSFAIVSCPRHRAHALLRQCIAAAVYLA